MKRRKTVSVTPAMGASTVAGVIWTVLMRRRSGTGVISGVARTPSSARSPELSQNFFTLLFYCRIQGVYATIVGQNEASVADSPKALGQELKSAILKKRVGQIALAVVLAQGCIRFSLRLNLVPADTRDLLRSRPTHRVGPFP